ncbi:MAG: crossover junction endodeoxyribonuclease RuvC [Candidatus Ancillula sp.]|jgi:crossover junction endodeoxyribonuclease RuvC|nr:crossover junction endodeoxyribonuclease RuvC [Candidatus Ancillula sp.]
MIIGIDPGLTRCGFAVLEAGEVVEIGVFSTRQDDLQEFRLLEQHNNLRRLLTKFNGADCLAIERPFLTRHNPDTAFGTAQVAGIAMLLAAEREIPVQLYTPPQVKLAVTGSGAAKKDQVAVAVSKLVDLHDLPKVADATDALAVALTASMRGGATQGVNSGSKQTSTQTEAQKLWKDALRAQNNGNLRQI